jgi:hypothetical protein
MRNGAPTKTPSTARAIARRESYCERSCCGGIAAGSVSARGASIVVLIPLPSAASGWNLNAPRGGEALIGAMVRNSNYGSSGQ